MQGMGHVSSKGSRDEKTSGVVGLGSCNCLGLSLEGWVGFG